MSVYNESIRHSNPICLDFQIKIEDIMSKRVSLIDHLGYHFILADFSGIQDETEYLNTFDQLEQEVLKLPKDGLVPMIVDISSSKMTPSISSRGRKLVENIKNAGYPDSPTVIVGGSKLQKAVVSAIAAFRHDILLAGSREDATTQLVAFVQKAARKE